MRRAIILVLVMAGIIEAGCDIQLELAGMESTGPYPLGHKHIIVNSEKIEHQGKILLSNVDYRIDYDNGLVIFTDTLSRDDAVKVTFSILPISIKSGYFLMQPVAISKIDTFENEVMVKPKRWSDQLEIIGSKGFVVNIGNRGEPSLSQSLDLNISGKLAQSVNVSGSISDRNFSTSPGGGTRSLDELDRVFLSLEAGGFRSDFGDIEVNGLKKSLLDFRRKLTGLNLFGNIGSFNGASAVAFSPGKQVELFFYGVDGKQGPYFLQDPELTTVGDVSTASVFLPGTEEVYLDGKKLKRGSENDYKINYYEGYIEFTPRNVISSRSRITIEIQYAPKGYRRSFYYGNGFYERKYNIGLQFIGESDDKSRPRSFDMGDEQRSAISQAGANGDSAYISGAKYIGPGGGNYLLETDTLGNSYYVYVGDGEGEYEVTFSRIAQGRGDYQYAGAGRYIYVGADNGSYLPLIYYPLPESRNYGSLMFNKPGNIHFGGELAVSHYDRNSLSTRDELLTGIGLLGSGGWRIKSLSFAGKTWKTDIFDFKFRDLDKHFSTPGIIDPPEFFRNYNIQQNRSLAGERLFEIQSKASTVSGDFLNAGGGILDGNDFEARRGFGKVNLITFDILALSSNVEISESEDNNTGRLSSWNKYEVGSKFITGMFKPGLAYRHELNSGLYSDSDGFVSDEYEGILEAIPFAQINSRTRFLYRQQKYFQDDSLGTGGWHNHYDQYQIEQNLIYGKTKSGFSGEVNLIRLYQKRFYPQKEHFPRNMGDLKINYSSSNFGFTFYESVNGSAPVSRVREYIYVGDGKGDYRKDGDDYVPEPGGDYIEIIRQIGEYEPLTGGLLSYEITGGIRVRFDGKGISKKSEDPWSVIINSINYEGDLSYKTNLAGGINLKAKHLFGPGKFYADEFIFKDFDFRQRTTFRINQKGDYIRHTLNVSRSQGTDFQFENLDDQTLSNIADLKVLSGGRTSYLISAEVSSDKRWLFSGKVDLDRLKIGFVPKYHPSSGLRIEAPFNFSTTNEKIREVEVLVYSSGLKAMLNFRKTGRVEAEGNYSYVDVDEQDIFLPYVIANGKKSGDNFNGIFSARFRLNSYSRMELRYVYKKLGDGYSNNNLRLEVKAEF